MCVQPMKSISAVALSEGWGAGTVTSSGILVGALTFLLGITNFIEVVNKIVPSNVVSGLQIGVGIRLASKGITMVTDLNWFFTSHDGDGSGHDCILLGVVCAVLCMYWLGSEGRGKITTLANSSLATRQRFSTLRNSNGSLLDTASLDESGLTGNDSSEGNGINTSNANERRISICNKVCCRQDDSNEHNDDNANSDQIKHPVGLYLFLIGALFASITLGTTKNENNQYDLPLRWFGAPIAYWAAGDVSLEDWKVGFLEGALPQLPLTTLNSVISVCALAHSLYPEKRKEKLLSSNDAVISRREVAISVGLMNLILCPFGSMPNCHGAGGLAGQHRLGARHGTSVVFLGISKIVLAIFFGASALTLLDAFPNAVLGVMLAIAGQELTTTGFTLLVRSVEDKFQVQIDNDSLFNGEDQEHENDTKGKSKMLRQYTVIAVITAMVIISLGKTHYGALSGFVAHMVYGEGRDDLTHWFRMRRQRSQSSQLSTRDNSDVECLPHSG